MLRFPNIDALHMALTSGLVPATVSLAPAGFQRHSGGAIDILPATAVSQTIAASLQQFGVEVVADGPIAETIGHWLQAIPIERNPRPPKIAHQTPVLIEGQEPAIAALSREILRLKNDRQSFRIIQSGSNRSILLQVLGPPFYSLLRAIERESAGELCAYLEAAPAVWIEFGWTHPLAASIRPADGQMILLRSPTRWRTLPVRAFHDLYEALVPDAELPSADWTDAPISTIEVSLKLCAGNTTDAPELWLLGESGEDQIDEFVRVTERQKVERLTFAVFETIGGRRVMLRSRPNPQGPPALEIQNAVAFRPFQRVPNLFVPCGSAIQPPLSREAVRRLLATDPDRIFWLMQYAGDFATESLPETAFQPLADWAEHILHLDRKKLESWVAASTCDFGKWTSSEEVHDRRESRRSLARQPSSIAPAETPDVRPIKSAPMPRRTRRPREASEVPPLALTSQPPNVLHTQLRALESRFIDLPGHLESSERQALWPQLGRLNSALGQTAEAALCWLNALWETRSAHAELAWAWVESERALSERAISEVDLARMMPAQPTTTADLRPLAAVIVWGCQLHPAPPVLRSRLPAIQSYLTKHDGLLPVRAVWLAWHGMIASSGGDALALARIRDRLLERLLTHGLNPERDLPAFLRFSGTHGGDRLRTVRDRMEVLRQAIHRWSGFVPNDGLQQTSAYIDLMFAFANARLGEAGAAQALLETASAQLDSSDNSAHRFLLEAFRWRIERVLAGKPHAGPLPAEQIEYLEQMRREVQSLKTTDPLLTMPPYVVERMRKESRIVDPHEELDPYRHTKIEHDTTIRELSRLADVHDPRALREGLRRILASAKTNSLPEVRLQVLADAIPLAARVGAVPCGELLDQVGGVLAGIPTTSDPIVQHRRAVLLERALLFAVHFDRTELVAQLAAQLEAAIVEPASATVWEARSRMIAESLHSLRKCGLRDEVERLLQLLADSANYDPADARAIASDRTSMEQARVLLHVASGWLSADHADLARPILDRARHFILTGRDVQHGDWLLFVSLISAYVTAAARAPLEESLDRIEELFTSGKMPRLPNSFTTHPYYSRLHLSIVESVVLALAHEDFTLGPAARRWLDDDEYLVRRRIHRDLRVAMNDTQVGGD